MTSKPIVDEQRALLRSNSNSNNNNNKPSSSGGGGGVGGFNYVSNEENTADGTTGWVSSNTGGVHQVTGSLVPQSMWRPQVAAGVMRDRLQQQQLSAASHKNRQFVSWREREGYLNESLT